MNNSLDDIIEENIETDTKPQLRLCSEIKLFDLCELEKCRFKSDRFCTDPEMLARFEAVAEPEAPSVKQFDDDDEDEEIGSPVEELEEDDDEYSVFDDEDRSEESIDEEGDDDW